MTIRKYVFEDENQVLSLFDQNAPLYFHLTEKEDLIHFLRNEIDSYFVLEINQQILACGGFNVSDDKKIVHISWDIVHPDFQGKGLGSALLTHRITAIQSISSVEKIIVRTSQLVYHFYAKFNFIIAIKIPDFWAPGFDLVQMERKCTK